MGFLETLFGTRNGPTDPRYLLIATMVDVMLADEEVDDAEVEVIRRATREHEYFRDLSDEEFDAHVKRAREEILATPRQSRRIEHLAENLPGRAYRLAAYALACEVAVADRTETSAETSFLEELRRAFMLDEQTAAEILSGARANAGVLSAEDSMRQSFELTPVFLDCMALMATADGTAEISELDCIKDLLENSPDLSLSQLADTDREIGAAVARARRQNAEQTLAQVARERLPHATDRFWALVYMAAIAAADGRSDWREAKLLESARGSFGLTDEMFAQALRAASTLRIR